MFDDYAKKLEELHFNVPKIFKQVAKLGAEHATNKAKEITDQEKLVDTGNYKRNWGATAIELDEETQGVMLENGVEYASHLEYGHRLRGGKGRYKGRFVGNRTLEDTAYFCLTKLDNALMRAIKKRAQGK